MATRKSGVAVAGTKDVVTEPVIDWSGIDDFDSAFAALNEAGIVKTDATEYGDGFILLDSKKKETLKGVDFLILSGHVRSDAATGREYVSLRIITEDGRKLVVNDGSVGIAEQAKRIGRERGSLTGVMVKGGLTGGSYTVEDPDSGDMIEASTYYFAGV
jgi:hypothetical protein